MGIYGYCHGFVTLTFNFKVTGGLLKVMHIFPHFGPVLIYRKLDHPMVGIYIIYINIYMSSVSMQKCDLEALH